MSSNVLILALVLVAGGQTAAAQREAMRFQSMDLNNDGRITRAEWKGSDQSFKVHDWNGDGVLSGDEVRPGARRGERANREQEFDGPDRESQFDDWTVRGFNRLDANRDNRITADEWHFDRESFRRADHNRDGAISRREFLSEDAGDQDDDREDGFANLDVNRDNRISREEWHWSRVTFDRLDKNRDGQLTREEFSSRVQGATRSQAYQAGRDRGLIEGRAAGREDRERNQGWDLEGQRELEQADSGYEARMGARADYQAGYREAFRIGYREGFGPR
jgi:Ca2+-binding EF-hand superfamily protein